MIWSLLKISQSWPTGSLEIKCQLKHVENAAEQNISKNNRSAQTDFAHKCILRLVTSPVFKL